MGLFGGDQEHYYAGYSRMEKEDPEDVKRRKAQFLIYKTLKQADNCRKKPSCWGIKILKFRVKIGRRIKTLRKIAISATKRGGFCNQLIAGHVRVWKLLFRGHRDNYTIHM